MERLYLLKQKTFSNQGQTSLRPSKTKNSINDKGFAMVEALSACIFLTSLVMLFSTSSLKLDNHKRKIAQDFSDKWRKFDEEFKR